jgi:hypothetical protein
LACDIGATMWLPSRAMTTADSLPPNAKALRALLLAERARHAEELAAARDEATRLVDARDEEIERLTAIIKQLQRHRFGPRSERLDPDQLALGLEDVEQTLTAAEAGGAGSAGRQDGGRAQAAHQSRRAAAPPAA